MRATSLVSWLSFKALCVLAVNTLREHIRSASIQLKDLLNSGQDPIRLIEQLPWQLQNGDNRQCTNTNTEHCCNTALKPLVYYILSSHKRYHDWTFLLESSTERTWARLDDRGSVIIPRAVRQTAYFQCHVLIFAPGESPEVTKPQQVILMKGSMPLHCDGEYLLRYQRLDRVCWRDDRYFIGMCQLPDQDIEIASIISSLDDAVKVSYEKRRGALSQVGPSAEELISVLGSAECVLQVSLES